MGGRQSSHVSGSEPPEEGPAASELRLLRSALRVALVADALDALGLRRQCLAPDLEPLDRGAVVVGRALPLTLERTGAVRGERYTGLLRALDSVRPDDVVVLSSTRATDTAIWGDLLSTTCRARGAAGAICAGFVRDAAAIRRLGFPVFAAGTVPYDIHGRFEVIAHGEPLRVDDVNIRRGDLVVADDDGVAIVPAEVEEQAIAAALAKAGREDRFRTAVAAGMLPSEAYERFGVL
jgi:4-hydroxy-4-methyl-2-oxoglutarate aldolase